MKSANWKKLHVANSRAAKTRYEPTKSTYSISRFGFHASLSDTNSVLTEAKRQSTQRAKYHKPSMPKMPWET